MEAPRSAEAETIRVVIVYPTVPEPSNSLNTEGGRSRSRTRTLGTPVIPVELSKVATTSRIALAAMTFSKAVAGETLRPGIEVGLTLLGTGGAAATAEETAVATAEGIGDVARAVEMIEPTGFPAGKPGGVGAGRIAGLARTGRAVTARERRLDRCMIVDIAVTLLNIGLFVVC